MATETSQSTGIVKAKHDLTDYGPLDRAYEAICGAVGQALDPLSESTARQLWRKIVARNAIREWVVKIEQDPRFCESLHIAIPENDIEMLEEFKTIASMESARGALYLLGLVNERLERLRGRFNNSVSFPFAGIVPGSMGAQAGGARVGASFSQQEYEGYVCAGVQNREGQWINGTTDCPASESPLPTKSHCRLAVWMQNEKPIDAWAESVLVGTGENEDIMSFLIEADCASFQLPYGRKRIRFHRRDKSPIVFFDFLTPHQEGEHCVYVHVLQETRLAKSLPVILKVMHRTKISKQCVPKAKRSSG